MSLAAAQPAKRNFQCTRSWRMQERQNHLTPIMVFQMPVTRKAIYVHYCLTCRLNCHEIPKFSPTNAPLVMKRINQMYKKSKQNDTTRKFKRREKKPSIFVAQPVKWMNLKDSKLSVRIINVSLSLPHNSC